MTPFEFIIIAILLLMNWWATTGARAQEAESTKLLAAIGSLVFHALADGGVSVECHHHDADAKGKVEHR